MENDLLDHPVISERYFFPRRDAVPEPLWVDSGDARLACSLHLAAPGAKTVVHFHGNGEVAADYLDDFVPSVLAMGFNCFLAEYRGYGASSGTPALARMLDDAVQVLSSLGEAPGNLVLFGRSVGSLYAVHGAAAFPDAAGLIIESGIADPLDRLLLRVSPRELGVTREAVEKAVARTLDQRRKIETFRGAVLVMHTRHDGLLDLSHAERLHEWARGPKRLVIFERGDHNSIFFMNEREYLQSLRDFLQEL